MAKKSACQEGDVGSKPRKGRPLGKGNGKPLEYLAWKISWTVSVEGVKSIVSPSGT